MREASPGPSAHQVAQNAGTPDRLNAADPRRRNVATDRAGLSLLNLGAN